MPKGVRGLVDEHAQPVHRVRVDGFFLDKTEVTNEQFERFVQATRMQTPAILCQPDSLTARQITKLVDFVTEREALPR